MRANFPTYSENARKGEAGVALVSKVVTDHLHWLFKRNHQEHDFGIDGQVEVVTEEGHVTGQFFGVQIKYGLSFFEEKNRRGYVYRGEEKHFNYLYNYPAPVVIVICHPESGDCYWAVFDPDKSQLSESGWKLTIPLGNKLASSKSELQELLGPPTDALNRLREYWALNNVLPEFDRILFVIDDIDVRQLNVGPVQSFFGRLRLNSEIASAVQGKVELSFFGFDQDPRELYEIPEFCRFARLLAAALPDLIFFSAVDNQASGLKAIVLGLSRGEIVGERALQGKQSRVEFETRLLADFLDGQWPGLNEMTDSLGMTEEENKAICYAVFRHLGIDLLTFDEDA